jgi:hypothetical protein
MLSVMTWNLENFERPPANAQQAAKDRYTRELQQITELITSVGPDLIGVQEVLADPKNLTPPALTTFAPHWVLTGTGVYPSGPTRAALAWAGWPAASCLTPPMSLSIRIRCRRPQSTMTGTRSPRSPPPSAGRLRSPSPALTA